MYVIARFSRFITMIQCVDACVRRFDEEKPVANEGGVREGQVRRWEFESSGKCFQECLGPGSRVPLTTRERKTTSAVKRRRRAGRVCRWHELTRRDATWRDVTWRDVVVVVVEDASRWDGRSPRIPHVAPRASTLRLQQLPCQDNQSGNRWVLVLI